MQAFRPPVAYAVGSSLSCKPATLRRVRPIHAARGVRRGIIASRQPKGKRAQLRARPRRGPPCSPCRRAHRLDRYAALPRPFCRLFFFTGAGTAASAASASSPWAASAAGCASPATRSRLRVCACLEGRSSRCPQDCPTAIRSRSSSSLRSRSSSSCAPPPSAAAVVASTASPVAPLSSRLSRVFFPPSLSPRQTGSNPQSRFGRAPKNSVTCRKFARTSAIYTPRRWSPAAGPPPHRPSRHRPAVGRRPPCPASAWTSPSATTAT